jgi:hypothetical protein
MRKSLIFKSFDFLHPHWDGHCAMHAIFVVANIKTIAQIENVLKHVFAIEKHVV